MATNMTPSILGGSGILNKHVLIIGHFELQNKLLEVFLYKEAGMKCSQLQSLDDYNLNPHGINFDMFLIDCSRKDVIEELDRYNKNSAGKEASPYLALFNVPMDAQLERRAIQRGVVGFFYETDSLDLILKGMTMIFEDHLWLPRKVFKRCLTEMQRVNPVSKPNPAVLTSREHEILAMIAQGSSNEDIAAKLCISSHTAKCHTHNIFRKIQVTNRIKAALWAKVNL